MLICSFHNKISSVNSQLSKEINFEILFRNIEHVPFCEISLMERSDWSVGHVYKYRTKYCRCWLSKFISNVKVLTFEKKFKIFISK